MNKEKDKRYPAEPENYLAAAEMSEESNCNQIDGIINNEPPKSSVREALRQHREQREEYERQKEMALEQTRGTPSGKER